MILINSLVAFVFVYFSLFFYYFSFNENFLLVFFFAFFLYVINSKLMGSLFESVDSVSLEIYLSFKQMSQNALSRLNYLKSNLEVYRETSDSVITSLETLVDLQLSFLLFSNVYKDLFFNQLLYFNATKLLNVQNTFIKEHVLKSIEGEHISLDFEAN
jgi:hypothetical protein